MLYSLMPQYYTYTNIWQWVQTIELQIYNLASKIRVTNICWIYKICGILDCAPDLR